MSRLTFSEVVTYFFFYAIIAALIAINYWNEKILSYLASSPTHAYIPLVITKAHLLYATLLIGFLTVVVFWEKERSRESLQYSFLTIITHKFRTPLSGIRWAIGGLREDKSIEERNELIQEIDNATERITQTVDTLTGLARFNDNLAYAFEAVSMRALLDQSIKKYAADAEKHNVTFKLNPSPDVPLIVIDRQKVQYVIDVLLENAIKYSKNGGVVTVSIAKTGRFVSLTVSDEGIGLSPVDRAKIFNRFFRAKDAQRKDPEGMGLSLPLVRTVMRHHGGTISVYSRGRGKGATFAVRFPLK